MHPPPDDEAHIEMHLGEIAADREEFEAALVHYRRAIELAPEQVDSWVELAKIYEQLDNLEEAVVHYQRAIQQEPDNEDLYYLLSKMFSTHEQPAKAIEAIEDGLNANPDSAVLNVYLASLYLEEMDYAQTEIFLNRAELLDPELEVIATFRQVLVMQKALAAISTRTGTGKLRQPKGKKKKRR
jgi:tetratricopeptide (TPR) repeat protein